MTDDHRSIGEVLELIREEFPDVTVSKIRFLESQGLIAPERTPSGYRKFYRPDIERLRWILVQQRDHYLPLRVIKSRLTEFEERRAVGAVDEAATDEATTGEAATDEAARTGNGAEDPPPSIDRGPDPVPAGEAVIPPRDEYGGAHDEDGDDVPASEAPAASGTGGASGGAGGSEDTRTGGDGGPPGAAGASGAAPAGGSGGGERARESGASLNRAELARLAGLDERTVRELEGYGLLPPPVSTGDEEVYDEQAVVVARLARGFLRHGVEPRHLRMYKTFAEREAGFVSQLVTPLLRQRNPEARQEARDVVSELARLGGGLRAAMLRLALRDELEE